MARERAQLTEKQLRERKEARREYLINLGRGLQDFIAHPGTLGLTTLGTALHGFANRNYPEGITATVALVYGGVAYAKGFFPFTEIKEPPAYELTEWFFEKPATPLAGPSTKVLLWPIIRKMKRNKEVVKIPATIQERDIQTRFQQPRKEGAGGKIKVQYGALIPTRYDARKFWRRTEEGNFKYIDDVVKTTIGTTIAKISVEQLVKGEYFGMLKNELNNSPEGSYKKYGVKIARISPETPEYDEKTKAFLESNLDLQTQVIDANAKAQALLIRAGGEAQEAEIQQRATTSTFPKYVVGAKQALTAAGITDATSEQIIGLAYKMWRGDNLQQTLSKAGGRNLINLPPEELG